MRERRVCWKQGEEGTESIQVYVLFWQSIKWLLLSSHHPQILFFRERTVRMAFPTDELCSVQISSYMSHREKKSFHWTSLNRVLNWMKIEWLLRTMCLILPIKFATGVNVIRRNRDCVETKHLYSSQQHLCCIPPVCVSLLTLVVEQECVMAFLWIFLMGPLVLFQTVFRGTTAHFISSIYKLLFCVCKAFKAVYSGR